MSRHPEDTMPPDPQPGAGGFDRGGIEVRCIGVNQVYELDGEQVVALADVDIHVPAAQSAALFGPSGSGKSTLTALLAGLRRPTSGEVWLGDDELSVMPERQLLRMRGRRVGVVLQNPSRSLLPYGTAEDNILFAQRAVETWRRRSIVGPVPLLRQLGLADLAGQRAGRLSGGEQQRLSIAVAMAGSPQLLLADEPTSQLDVRNRDRVVELLAYVTEQFGTTVVVVTHDPVVADAMHRRITLAEGRVVADGTPSPTAPVLGFERPGRDGGSR
jgi:putative ABC transport system ATP-binding protein